MNKLKRLTKHGDNYAIIIDKSILDLLGINNTTLLQISIYDGKSIIIKPFKNKKDRKITAALKKINNKYHDTLKRLAK